MEYAQGTGGEGGHDGVQNMFNYSRIWNLFSWSGKLLNGCMF